MINDLHIKILGKKITKRMLLHSSTKDSIVSSLMSMFNIEYTEAVILMVIFQDSVKNNNEFSTFEFKNTFKISDIEYFSVLPALKTFIPLVYVLLIKENMRIRQIYIHLSPYLKIQLKFS